MCRIFNTPVIKFVVGKEEKEMMMHTVLVAEQSRALRSLVNGPMKEAQNNTVGTTTVMLPLLTMHMLYDV